MGLMDDIKKQAANSSVIIQSSFEADIQKTFNKLFYAEKNIKEEVAFIKQVMTRGTEQLERCGLHASAIIVGEKEFCVREQVLSLIYKQLQGDNVQVGLKRIFEEGNAIHEKWQRLFIRGGLGKAVDMDNSQFSDAYDLSYTPDAIITIDGQLFVIEIKSVNTYQFKKMNDHPSGRKQLQFYMYLTGIKHGIVLCDDKNTQDFKVFYHKFDSLVTDPYVERLEAIQYYKQRLLVDNKVPPRHPECESYSSKRCVKCNMKNVCWGRSKEKLVCTTK